jgi:hypothetical protein
MDAHLGNIQRSIEELFSEVSNKASDDDSAKVIAADILQAVSYEIVDQNDVGNCKNWSL